MVILHSDLNCFYAAAEMNEDPSLRGKKMAVCGSTEDRHGIVLAKSYEAKACGVQTGQANWQARQVCPDLICVPPHYELYLKYSRTVRSIYRRYSTVIEPYGMDENWISLPQCMDPLTDGAKIADEIRRAVANETGLTVSIGVSFSKVFAKLGSDMKKPDAITVISRENYRQKIWPLPVSDLLYVGRATNRKLAGINVRAIGDLALCEPEVLRTRLGKNGLMLRSFARGEDGSAVMPENYVPPLKSVGHGATCVTDLDSEYAVWRVIYALAQDVSHRMRENGLLAGGVSLTVKDRDLGWSEYQTRLPFFTRRPYDLSRIAFDLFRVRYDWYKPVRALTIRAIRLRPDREPVQMDCFGHVLDREKRRRLDDAVDEIRRRFGEGSVSPAALLGELGMAKDHCETVPMPGMMYR